MLDHVIDLLQAEIAHCMERTADLVESIGLTNVELQEHASSALYLALAPDYVNSEFEFQQYDRFQTLLGSTQDLPESALYALCALVCLFSLNNFCPALTEPKEALTLAIRKATYAREWLGYVDAALKVGNSKEKIRAHLSEQTRKAGKARQSNDPKRASKLLVKNRWDEWQGKPYQYPSKSAFAREMLNAFQNLDSQRVIERWCLEWERSAH